MVEWRVSPGLTDYRDAERAQEARVDAMAANGADELIWLLEHPPLITAGPSAQPADLLEPDRFPVYATRRGGEHTYHGPGQRVAYALLDLNARGRDVRLHVWRLEEWTIRTLATFGVVGERRSGRVGVWVARRAADGADVEEKIAAIGVRVRKWTTFHGLSINVAPDLAHFDAIVPCGIRAHGVTSLRALGVDAETADVDAALRDHFDAAMAARPA